MEKYSAVNMRELKKAVEVEMSVGDTLFVSVLGLTEKAFNLLKTYIMTGRITPVREEVERMYKDVEAVMNGYVVMPQMTYVKER